jgi:peptide/nickel transport system substrate-binding protein
VTADLLTRLGAKVDYVAVDWGTVVSRRTQKAPPDKGGRNLFGAYLNDVDCADPTCKVLRAHGDKAFFGWPNIPALEAEIASWYDARNFAEEKAAARLITKLPSKT